MKKIFTTFVFALLTALWMTVAAGSYTITFKDNSNSTSDSNTAVDATTFQEWIETGADYITSTQNIGNKVYQGKAGRGLKFGSSKSGVGNRGNLFLSLSDEGKKRVTKISIEVFKYSSDNNSFSINGNVVGSATSVDVSNTLSYTLTEPTVLEEITVQETVKRAYLKSITVEYQDEAPAEPAATPTITPVDGTYVGKVQFSLSSTDPNAQLHYKFGEDGQEQVYTAPVDILKADHEIVDVYAWATAEGKTQSEMASVIYDLSGQHQTAPTITPGTTEGITDESIALNFTTDYTKYDWDVVEFRYTTAEEPGNDYTSWSVAQDGNATIALEPGETVSVTAVVLINGVASETATELYERQALPVTPVPTITPAVSGKTYFGKVEVSIAPAQDGDVLTYRIGETGTEQVYNGPVTLTKNIYGEQVTVYAWAERANHQKSEAVMQSFDLSAVPAAPIVEPGDSLTNFESLYITFEDNNIVNSFDDRVIIYRYYEDGETAPEGIEWKEGNPAYSAHDVVTMERGKRYKFEAKLVYNDVVESDVVTRYYTRADENNPQQIDIVSFAREGFPGFYAVSGNPKFTIVKNTDFGPLVKSGAPYMAHDMAPTEDQINAGEVGDENWQEFDQSYWFIGSELAGYQENTQTQGDVVRVTVSEENGSLSFPDATFVSVDSYTPNVYRMINFGDVNNQGGKFYVKPKNGEWLKVKEIFIIENPSPNWYMCDYILTNVAPGADAANRIARADGLEPEIMVGLRLSESGDNARIQEYVNNRTKVTVEGIFSRTYPTMEMANIHYIDEIAITPAENTGVADNLSRGEVVSVVYTNPAGLQSEKPFEGVNIVTRRYSDGSVKVTKVIR